MALLRPIAACGDFGHNVCASPVQCTMLGQQHKCLLYKGAVKPQTRTQTAHAPTAVRLQITESQNCQVTASHDTSLVPSPVFSDPLFQTFSKPDSWSFPLK